MKKDPATPTVSVNLALALAPLALTLLITWLTMEGHLNFGGGEKGIFIAVPLVVWSFAWLLLVIFSLLK